MDGTPVSVDFNSIARASHAPGMFGAVVILCITSSFLVHEIL